MLTDDLFSAAEPILPLSEGASLLRGWAIPQAQTLLEAIDRVALQAPFRRMQTAGGHALSVEMTNAGVLGWISDRRGYRYVACDPESGQPWPACPEVFRTLAAQAADQAGYPGFAPEACLINRYAPGARMALHQDRDEQDLSAPIVSVSLGLPAIFLWGGVNRQDKPQTMCLQHGDVVVWGGPSRLRFHGVKPVPAGTHPLTGSWRYNLTFRRVTEAR